MLSTTFRISNKRLRIKKTWQLSYTWHLYRLSFFYVQTFGCVYFVEAYFTAWWTDARKKNTAFDSFDCICLLIQKGNGWRKKRGLYVRWNDECYCNGALPHCTVLQSTRRVENTTGKQLQTIFAAKGRHWMKIPFLFCCCCREVEPKDLVGKDVVTVSSVVCEVCDR